MLIGAIVSWVIVRTKIPGRWVLDNLASMPLVFPGLVLGLSIMICYLYIDIGVYGTIWILLIAYVTRFLPYGIALRVDLDAADPQGARGIGRHERSRPGR